MIFFRDTSFLSSQAEKEPTIHKSTERFGRPPCLNSGFVLSRNVNRAS